MSSAPRPPPADHPSALIGRARELAALAACFDDGARLVTVLGPAGVGKTRLALRFAADHAAAYAAHGGGGAAIGDLVDARSAMAICATVGAALGIPLPRDTSEARVAARLGAALVRRGRVLLVLDNFEHLVGEAAATVGVWLAAAPRARFVVTSRVPLGLPGEQLWPLDGLAVPTPGAPPDEARGALAVELFVRRARQVRPDLPLDEPALAAIAEIVARLDGLPLAIELAAARVRVLSPTQIRDRLAAPLALLVRPGDGGRHGSMRGAIIDSVRALEPATLACFAGCTIFRGGWSLDDAEAVLGDPGAPALTSLDALCQQSLVRTTTLDALDGEPRFALYEAIREVAAEQLDPARRAVLEGRHARAFAALAERLSARAVAAGERAIAARVAVELENLVEAHRRALALPPADGGGALALAIALVLEPLLAIRGMYRLRLRVLDEAIAATPGVAAAPHAAAWLARGHAHRELGDLGRARADLEVGRDLAARAGAHVLVAVAELRLGEIVETSGATAAARAHFERALGHLADAPPSRLVEVRRAEAHTYLGHARRREGELAAAERELGRALAIARAVGHAEGVALACYELAVIALFHQRYAEARARYDEGLAIARELGARQLEAAITSGRGVLLQEQGSLDDAIADHAAAVATFVDLGNRHREASARYYLGAALLERGELAQAEVQLAAAAGAAREVGAPRYLALIDGARAVAAALGGDDAEATAALARAGTAADVCHSEPTLRTTLALHARQLGRAAATPAAWATSLEEARAAAAAQPGDDPRFALRLLEGGAARGPRLIVRGGAAAVRLPGAAADLDLSRRGPLRRLVAALARHRVDAPGDALALDDLLAAGWPGERVGHEAAVNRVHVALTTLRKLGLRGILLSVERGYLLSPSVAISLDDGP